ncbi:hypothetical protein MT325_m839R [Paramecium bursaria chlorella virus MT325]|uniref:Uncharacterized protein m839R n=1 Tax=Paramecium bursaria Chlorella virus MT325 TaxID=346932 RepID=A7IVL9_PBCVM|nr:hypothetical protein MT325_m839R [Paramecium bursaria chlorella virus MT325]AGE49680.1 hypothetical protein PBCVCan184_010L [Paramecium bursaria Chlorella virus Can18-4]
MSPHEVVPKDVASSVPFPIRLARWFGTCIAFDSASNKTITLVDKVNVNLSAFDNDDEIASFCDELKVECPTLAIIKDGSHMSMVGHLEIVRFLLEHGADIRAESAKTPFEHLGCMRDRSITYLLDWDDEEFKGRAREAIFLDRKHV